LNGWVLESLVRDYIRNYHPQKERLCIGILKTRDSQLSFMATPRVTQQLIRDKYFQRFCPNLKKFSLYPVAQVLIPDGGSNFESAGADSCQTYLAHMRDDSINTHASASLMEGGSDARGTGTSG